MTSYLIYRNNNLLTALFQSHTNTDTREYAMFYVIYAVGTYKLLLIQLIFFVLIDLKKNIFYFEKPSDCVGVVAGITPATDHYLSL